MVFLRIKKGFGLSVNYNPRRRRHRIITNLVIIGGSRPGSESDAVCCSMSLQCMMVMCKRGVVPLHGRRKGVGDDATVPLLSAEAASGSGSSSFAKEGVGRGSTPAAFEMKETLVYKSDDIQTYFFDSVGQAMEVLCGKDPMDCKDGPFQVSSAAAAAFH